MAKKRTNEVIAQSDGNTVSYKELPQEWKKRKYALFNVLDNLFQGHEKEINRLKIARLEAYISTSIN